MKTVVGLYDRFEDAQRAITDLRDAGFRSEDISLVARDADGELTRNLGGSRPAEANDISDGTATGAGVGAVLGGLGGLLVGLGALAIPGIGPVLAAGPLVSALAGAGIGALTGGVIGALVDMGIPEEHAEYYAEGIRRGGTLLIVRSDDMSADRVMTIMNRYNPEDVMDRAENWRRNNWTGYKPDADPLTEEEMEFNRRHEHTSIPVTGESTFGTDSQDLDRDDFDRESGLAGQDPRDKHHFDHEHMDHETGGTIPLTGSTMGSSTMDRDMDRMQDYDRVDQVCMPHYQSNYGMSGQDYAYYQPAYRFGYDLANDPRYRDYDWDQMEMEARREWESRGERSAWDEVKAAVRHAWYELRH